MKKLFILLLLIFYSTVSAQVWESIGAGVVNFLLSSPKSANAMNTDQQIALSLIGGLLNKAGDRKHDLNVAEAGKTQITLNTPSGQQIQLAMDTNGNVFAISEGILYPIGENVVKQAEEFVLNQQPGYMDFVRNKSENKNAIKLPDYNISVLQNSWDKEKPYTIIEPKANSKLYLSELLRKFDVNLDQLFFYGQNDEIIYLKNCHNCNTYLNNKKRFRAGDYGTTRIRADVWPYITQRQILILNTPHTPRGTFIAGWFNDINQNSEGEFNEFQDVRRNYYQNESFIIVCGLYSNYDYTAEIKIYEQVTGKLVFKDKYSDNIASTTGFTFSYGENFFKPGIYTYYITLYRKDRFVELQKYSDKFQILTTTNLDKDPIVTSPINNSSNKSDAMSELIQLLKDGKISEETFRISMEALGNQQK